MASTETRASVVSLLADVREKYVAVANAAFALGVLEGPVFNYTVEREDANQVLRSCVAAFHLSAAKLGAYLVVEHAEIEP